MHYYFLKLGKGNAEATSLQGRKPTASVYFDDYSETAYEKKRKKVKSQSRLFWSCGKDENRASTVMVVIHQAKVWLLQPAGEVQFGRRFMSQDGWWLTKKTMSVKVLASVSSKYVPPVLAGIGSSQKHGRRTFTQVYHWGNLKAIDWVLQKCESPKSRTWVPGVAEAANQVEEHWRKLDANGKPNQTAAQLLECLGSTEMETLVAKVLEAHGCHVPAHRGGTLGDIDLFAWNDSGKALNLNGLKIPSHGKVSIQVKSKADGKSCPSAVDFLIGIGVKGKRTFDERWLLAEVRKKPEVCRWMLRSLNWLPRWFLRLPQFGLAPFLSESRRGGMRS